MKRALVVVDMIEDFVHEGGALYCGPSMAKIVPVIQRELARARSSAEPVVYLRDEHLPGDAEFQMVPPHAIAGTKGRRIVPALTTAVTRCTRGESRSLRVAPATARSVCHESEAMKTPTMNAASEATSREIAGSPTESDTKYQTVGGFIRVSMRKIR